MEVRTQEQVEEARVGDMVYYRLNELDFIVPEGWRDGSMNAFVLPQQDGKVGGEAALVINRDDTQPYADLHEYADRQMVEAAKRFPEYRLTYRRTIHVDGQLAIELAYAWKVPKEISVRQYQLIMKLDGLFLNFTLSVREQDAAHLEEIWSTVIGSIRLRDM